LNPRASKFGPESLAQVPNQLSGVRQRYGSGQPWTTAVRPTIGIQDSRSGYLPAPPGSTTNTAMTSPTGKTSQVDRCSRYQGRRAEVAAVIDFNTIVAP